MKKKRKWVKWALVLIVLALIVGSWAFFSRSTQSAAYSQTQVTQGNIETTYNFDGVVHARRMQTILADAPDTIKTVYVKQNEQVSEGDKLYKTEGGKTVCAQIDGELTGLYVTAGDVIAAGETTAQIIDMGLLEVQLNVDEYDVKAIVPGNPAEISVLALDKTFTGTVRSLNKNGTAAGDLSYYTAYVDLEQTEGVYPGMQVSAKMLRAKAENAVLLKMNAIQFDEYNQPYVYVPSASGEEPAKVSVEIGISDGIQCEIISGLYAGQTVLVPNGMSMAEMMELMRENGPMAR